MPTIKDVLAPAEGLSPLQRKIKDYLNNHPEEVFSYADVAELAKCIGHNNPNGVRMALWSLDKAGIVAKIKVPARKRTYFGSQQAINKVKAHLSYPPFLRA